MDSLAFLAQLAKQTPRQVYVLHGGEDFLKRQVMLALRKLILGAEGVDFGLSNHEGDKVSFAAVRNELETLPFVGERRLVVVDGADPFVSKYRAQLEKYVPQPAPTGVLVLVVKSWPATTRLYKLVAPEAAIACESLSAGRLPGWCSTWAASHHAKQLSAEAAGLLVDLVGTDMGQLDQEIAKLATYAGSAARIESADVDKLVGSSRAEITWKIFDALAQGKAGEALTILDRLLDQGEEPIRILGAFSMQLRRLAQAARLAQTGQPLDTALHEAGFTYPNQRKGAEQQLRYLGRRRLDRLYDWLLEIDLGLKGSSQLPPRTQLERLVVRLGRKNEPLALGGLTSPARPGPATRS
jgi:DNA polymerase-3 subunit delta